MSEQRGTQYWDLDEKNRKNKDINTWTTQFTKSLPSRLLKHKANPSSTVSGYLTSIRNNFSACLAMMRHSFRSSPKARMKFLLEGLFAWPLKSIWYLPFFKVGVTVFKETRPTRELASTFWVSVYFDLFVYVGSFFMASIVRMLIDPMRDSSYFAYILASCDSLSGRRVSKTHSDPEKFPWSLPTYAWFLCEWLILLFEIRKFGERLRNYFLADSNSIGSVLSDKLYFVVKPNRPL